MHRKLLILVVIFVGAHIAQATILGLTPTGTLVANLLEISASALAAAMCFGAARRAHGNGPPVLDSRGLRDGYLGRGQSRLDVLRACPSYGARSGFRGEIPFQRAGHLLSRWCCSSTRTRIPASSSRNFCSISPKSPSFFSSFTWVSTICPRRTAQQPDRHVAAALGGVRRIRNNPGTGVLSDCPRPNETHPRVVFRLRDLYLVVHRRHGRVGISSDRSAGRPPEHSVRSLLDRPLSVGRGLGRALAVFDRSASGTGESQRRP